MLRNMLTTWVTAGRPVDKMMCNWTWSWGPDLRKASYMESRAAALATFSMLQRFSGLVGLIIRTRSLRLSQVDEGSHKWEVKERTDNIVLLHFSSAKVDHELGQLEEERNEHEEKDSDCSSYVAMLHQLKEGEKV